ncbi:tetratricopeptide repeat protein [bacterium]|nr:tetratricopeptide repeat protein [bacterium]
MKRIILWSILLLQTGLVAAENEGFNLFHPDALGGQFVGTRKDATQIPSSGVGPGLSVFLRYDLSPRVLIDLSTGFNTAMADMFSAGDAVETLFPNLVLKTNFKLLRDAKLTPFIYTGFMGAMVSRSEKVPNLGTVESSANHAGILIGSGFIYKSYYNFSITMNADFRYALYSSNEIKSKYWVFETGMSVPLKRPQPEPEFDDDFFIPQDEKEVAVAEEAAPANMAMLNDEFSMFLHKVESLLDRIEDKQKQLEVLEARVMANEKAIATVTGFVASEFVNYTNVMMDEAGTGDSSAVHDEYMNMYQTALNQYNKQQYAPAIRKFEKLLVQNPAHPLSSNCQYWIGESYRAQNDYVKASEAYNAVLAYTLSSKYDDALLMSGVCQLELGNESLAREYFSELVNRYPESELVGKANEYLESM